MHCFRKKNNKAGVLLLLLAAFMAAVMSAVLPAAAADTEVIFDSEDEGAAKGHVYVRAVVEAGYEEKLEADLLAVTEGGTIHHYELSENNGYGVSDDVAIGKYILIPYLEETADTVTRVEYGGGEQEISEDGTAYFVAVMGSDSFVREYAWLSDYRDDNGRAMKGIITIGDAERLFAMTVASQDEQEEYIYAEIGQEGQGSQEIEMTSGSETMPQETPVQAQPVPQDSRPRREWLWLLIAAPALLAAAVRVKRNRKRNSSR